MNRTVLAAGALSLALLMSACSTGTTASPAAPASPDSSMATSASSMPETSPKPQNPKYLTEKKKGLILKC